MAAFLIDAQLPPGLARHLVAAGHRAEHVFELDLNAAADHVIARVAEARQAILITKDQDFVEMARSGRLDCPLLWVRLGNVTNAALWASLEPLLDEILSAFALGESVVELA